MFRRAAACETIRIGTPPIASSSCADERRIVCRPVADRAEDRHVVLARDVGDVAAASAIASARRRASSIVTDTLTSDVVTTSTDVRCCSNTSKMRRRKPCAISMRVDVMSTTVTPASTRPPSAAGRSADARA